MYKNIFINCKNKCNAVKQKNYNNKKMCHNLENFR